MQITRNQFKILLKDSNFCSSLAFNYTDEWNAANSKAEDEAWTAACEASPGNEDGELWEKIFNKTKNQVLERELIQSLLVLPQAVEFSLDEIKTLESIVSRFQNSAMAANRRMPGFYRDWAGDSLLDEARSILRKDVNI